MHVWAIVFGCIIGWGSFINSGKKFLPNSGVAGTAIVMIFVGGKVILPSAPRHWNNRVYLFDACLSLHNHSALSLTQS